MIVSVVLVVGGGNLVWTSINVSRTASNLKTSQTAALTTARVSQRNAIQAAIAASNRQWCDSLDLLTAGQQPSRTQTGIVKLDTLFQQLERKFGCDDK